MGGSTLYPLFSTGLILIVILINFIRRTDTDHFQRSVYLAALISVLASIVTHFAGTMLEGRPGPEFRNLVLAVYTLFFIVQQCSYHLIVVLLDYIVNKNSDRTKKFIYLVAGIMALNIFIMIMNIYFGFYFSVTQDNYFMYSDYFLIRFYMSYSAVLIAVVDMFLSARHLRSSQLYLVVLFAVLIGSGAALNTVFSGGNIIWAFFTASLLGAYFYIIHSDTTLDLTTGIGNRSSFTEFINQAARANGKQSYSMILFDINDLKKINDTHGVKAGDEALADMAKILKQCSRQSDFIARMGDDKFIVAIRAKYDVKRMLSRILEALDAQNKTQEKPYVLSVSYGSGNFNTRSEQSAEEFLQTLNDLVFRHKTEQRSEAAAATRRETGV